jgi:hypothetical protein
MQKIRPLIFVALILTIAGIAPCLADQAGDSAFLERAKSYWELQLKDDWPGRYDFITPAARAQITRDQYVAERSNAPLHYISYDLGKFETSGNMAWMEVTFEAKVKFAPDSPAKKVSIWQLWRKDKDGQWCTLSPEESEQEPKLPPSLRATPDTEALAKRADELWRAKENLHLNTVYELIEPKFKEKMSIEEFTGKKGLLSYYSHAVEWAETTGDSGRVKIKSMSKPSDPHLSKGEPMETSSIEKWVKIDGLWYLKFED